MRQTEKKKCDYVTGTQTAVLSCCCCCCVCKQQHVCSPYSGILNHDLRELPPAVRTAAAPGLRDSASVSGGDPLPELLQPRGSRGLLLPGPQSLRAGQQSHGAPDLQPAASGAPELRSPGGEHQLHGAFRVQTSVSGGPVQLPPGGVCVLSGPGGPRRKPQRLPGAGTRLRGVGGADSEGGEPYEGCVFGAGRYRVCRSTRVPERTLPLHQVHRALLHHHAALLLLPRMLRGGPVLPRSHGHGGREAFDARGSRHLVVRGSDLAHHRRVDAQRLQQLVHLLLRKEG